MELSTLTGLQQLDIRNNELTGEFLRVSYNGSTARTKRVPYLNEVVPRYTLCCQVSVATSS